MKMLCRLSALLVCALGVARAGSAGFTVVGNKIYDADGNWIVFRGIGFTCTEYMSRPMFPAPGNNASGDSAEGGDWPGKFAWQNCFVGVPGPNATFTLANETQFVLNYLLPDSRGGAFPTKPTTRKVAFDPPWNEVVDPDPSGPRVVPIVRVPVTASTYLYDEDCDEVGSAGYREMIDMLVQYFTSNGVAVIIDQHASCAQMDCNRAGPMALRNFGNYSGAGAFWSAVAARYSDNPYVLFELYNEPHCWYQAWYAGDPIYIGMAEMLDIVRSYGSNLAVIGGHDQYAQDAAGSVAFYLQYMREHNGSAPSNVLYNLHPYQGAYQGLEHSVRSTMRLTLALKTIGPVIFTELGQYCCSPPAQGTSCEKKPMCIDHEHGDYFVYNLLNLAAQYDVSWTGWGWRGRGSPSDNCTQGETQCNTPDMRDVGPGGVGVLTNGRFAGANWTDAWQSFVAPPGGVIVVADALPNVHLNGTAYEPRGYLPRPCIVGQFALSGNCGYPLGTNLSVLDKDWNSFWNQTVFEAVLPGLPPSANSTWAASTAAGVPLCTLQACPGYSCNSSSPIIPEPHPCGTTHTACGK